MANNDVTNFIPYCLGIKFTAQEHAKYTRRMEEGYDLLDARYDQWLQMYHPEDGNLLC